MGGPPGTAYLAGRLDWMCWFARFTASWSSPR